MGDSEQQKLPSSSELAAEQAGQAGQAEKRAPSDFDHDNDSATDVGDPSGSAEGSLFPETDLSRGIVGWDGQKDPHNPQNFAPSRKWGLLGLVSAMTFVSPLASSMFAPAVSYMAKDLHVVNETVLSLSVSIYLLGYTVRYLVLRVSQTPYNGLARGIEENWVY